MTLEEAEEIMNKKGIIPEEFKKRCLDKTNRNVNRVWLWNLEKILKEDSELKLAVDTFNKSF